MLGCAAGTYVSLGEDGSKTQRMMAHCLGLQTVEVPSRATLDRAAEYVLRFRHADRHGQPDRA